jgi:hypothetical protein
MVTLWTPNSVRSDWVRAEAHIGYERGLLVPIVVGVALEDIPRPFNAIQALIARNGMIGPDEMDHLINGVRSLLAKEQQAMPTAKLGKDDEAGTPRPQQAIKKAFVSYASEDEEIAVELVKHLEKTDCPCWISFRDVDPSEDYRASIVTAIAEIKFLVLVYSAHVNRSFDVANELLLARKRNKRRFVIKTDESEPGGPVEYELASVQWVDGQKNRMKAFDRIAERARLL